MKRQTINNWHDAGAQSAKATGHNESLSARELQRWENEGGKVVGAPRGGEGARTNESSDSSTR